MDKIKVLIADDHPIVRDGLRQLLDGQRDMEVAGEARDGLDVLKKCKELQPNIALLDIAMPRLSGLEAVRLIKEAVPETRIVILSMYKKEAYVHEVLSCGAMGYVLKASSTSEVLKAIRTVNQGQYFLDSQLSNEVIEMYSKTRRLNPESASYDLLSAREQQVFRLLVEGNSTKEIAGVLYVSPKTVEKHRVNIMHKLGTRDLVGLVKYAVKIGIVDPDRWES